MKNEDTDKIYVVNKLSLIFSQWINFTAGIEQVFFIEILKR